MEAPELVTAPGFMKVPGDLVVTAPGRANLLGNPSDQYGGAQISCSVGLRARVALHAAAPWRGCQQVLLETAGASCRVDTESLDADIATLRGDLFDLARVALADARSLPGQPGIAPLQTRPARARTPVPDLDETMREVPGGSRRPGETPESVTFAPCVIAFGSEIPLRSGLAGSTALLVALVQALAFWRGASLHRHALAERARRVEADRMKITCGFGDQYMTTFGGLRYLDFRGKERATFDDPGPYATVESIALDVDSLPFVLAYTGVRHSSSAVHTPIRARWLAGERAVVDGQAQIAHLAALGKQALLDDALDRFGALMNENHDITRELGGSGESNEQLIAAALAAGARGAKLAGAGDGGTVVALARAGETAQLEAALREAGAVETWRLADSRGVWVEKDVPQARWHAGEAG